MAVTKRKSLKLFTAFGIYFQKKHCCIILFKKIPKFWKVLVNKVKGKNLLWIFPKTSSFVFLPKVTLKMIYVECQNSLKELLYSLRWCWLN